MLPAFIKRRERRQWTPGQANWYWIADAPCGMEVMFIENLAIEQWTSPDKIWCHHAQCDMCDAADHTIVAHADCDDSRNWFPVLACNSWLSSGIMPGCDGVNHTLNGFSSGVEDCYWWYQGNYPNGWVYWMGDWRCGPCTTKSIIGPRS